MTHVAVLTGDLIDSSRAGPEAVDITLDQIQRLLAAAEQTFALAPVSFTRFRGDGWQAVIDPSPRFLRVTTHLLTGLRASGAPLATRIGIGIGDVTRRGDGDLSAAAGSALTRSGHALDGMPSTETLSFNGSETSDTLTYLAARWSREQAEALHARLGAETMPLHDIARSLGISRQALSSRLAVAGERPIMALIRAAESAQ
jgi:hypothetical protein